MIKENLEQINLDIPKHVTLVAVSKTKPHSMVLEAYEAGQRVFGENKAQAIEERFAHFNNHPDIEWHFIGHLQRNKVKQIISGVSFIHSIDSERLLLEVNKRAEQANRVVSCLLQFHIAKEDTKFGFSLEEATEMINRQPIDSLPNVKICGVMGMATFTENEAVIRSEFQSLRAIFEELKQTVFAEKEYFKHVSMGMSNDFKIAIEEGSTMVRIGSSIFGSRS
ncbi:MAG: YggS family pyridoxal phosphate-dependent enzyme [Luteibaculaceae bacterium]